MAKIGGLIGHLIHKVLTHCGGQPVFVLVGQQKTRHDRVLYKKEGGVNYNDPESSLLALNLATFLALILMVSPLKGLRPVRAALLDTEKVPNPTRVSLSPFFKVFVTPSWKESRAAAAATLVMPASSAILLINSALFILR